MAADSDVVLPGFIAYWRFRNFTGRLGLRCGLVSVDGERLLSDDDVASFAVGKEEEARIVTVRIEMGHQASNSKLIHHLQSPSPWSTTIFEAH